MAVGTFISLDGPDGAGKSTQCRLLADWLREAGHLVTTCRDPGGTSIGDRIRELLLDTRNGIALNTEAFLYMASRSQLVCDVIGPALTRGQVVVSDRFLLANIVYQGHAGGLPPEILRQIGEVATGGLRPDLTIVLDVAGDVGTDRRRGPPDRIESRDRAYHERVRQGFLLEAARAPDRISVIDANRSVEAVHNDVRREVERVLGTRSRP